MRVPLGGIHRGDHNVVAPGVGFLLGYSGDPEFGIQLAHPLQHQRSGNKNEHPGHKSPHQIFLQHKPGFNRLAKPDLIGENRAA
ncbi:hypothetical protein D3C86_2104650 [compost metagenome]